MGTPREDRRDSDILEGIRHSQWPVYKSLKPSCKNACTHICAQLYNSIVKMNHRLSTTRSARSRGRTLLSIDKNYARRVDTLYRKAFEAPGAIADEATRKRCRLAVMQELDGVCTVFLTHNDSSWPPSREQLKVIAHMMKAITHKADDILGLPSLVPAGLYFCEPSQRYACRPRARK